MNERDDPNRGGLLVHEDTNFSSSVMSNTTPVFRTYKVAIGNPHKCSCGSRDICQHILFCMIKVLGVPRDNPLVWQRALVEREINMIISGRLVSHMEARGDNSQRPRHNFLRRRSSSAPGLDKSRSRKSKNVERRSVDASDKCPVCLECLRSDHSDKNVDVTCKRNSRNLVFCKKGCGKSLHADCMLVWAEHQNSVKKTITCPFCREDWGPMAIHALRNGGKTPRTSRHVGVLCANCPKLHPRSSSSFIVGTRYRCAYCADYDLCSQCFASSSVHAMHQFVCRDEPRGPWHPAKRSFRVGHRRSMSGQLGVSHAPDRGLNEYLTLQHREITPNDYDLLMRLEGYAAVPPPTHEHPQSHQQQSSDTSAANLPSYLVQCLSTYGGSRPSRRELDQARIVDSSLDPSACCGSSGRVRLPCKHWAPETDLLDRFSRREFACPECDCPIFRGLSQLLRNKNRCRPVSVPNSKTRSSTAEYGGEMNSSLNNLLLVSGSARGSNSGLERREDHESEQNTQTLTSASLQRRRGHSSRRAKLKNRAKLPNRIVSSSAVRSSRNLSVGFQTLENGAIDKSDRRNSGMRRIRHSRLSSMRAVSQNISSQEVDLQIRSAINYLQEQPQQQQSKIQTHPRLPDAGRGGQLVSPTVLDSAFGGLCVGNQPKLPKEKTRFRSKGKLMRGKALDTRVKTVASKRWQN